MTYIRWIYYYFMLHIRQVNQDVFWRWFYLMHFGVNSCLVFLESTLNEGKMIRKMQFLAKISKLSKFVTQIVFVANFVFGDKLVSIILEYCQLPSCFFENYATVCSKYEDRPINEIL